MTRIRYFAAAAEAAGVGEEQLAAPTLGELRRIMVEVHGPALDRVLGRCSLLVNGTRTAEPSTPVGPDDQVDVLPPFAGG